MDGGASTRVGQDGWSCVAPVFLLLALMWWWWRSALAACSYTESVRNGGSKERTMILMMAMMTSRGMGMGETGPYAVGACRSCLAFGCLVP